MGEKIMDGFPSREEALADFFAAWEPARSVEYVALDDAVGRVLACDLASTNTLPVVRASSFDSIAVKSAAFANGMPDTSSWKPGVDYVRADTGDDFPRRVRRRGDDREGGRSGGRIGNVRRRRDRRARFGRAARRLHAARGRAAHERRQHYPTHRPGRSRHGRRHDGARARQTARGVHSHGQRARTRRHQAPTRSKRGHEQPHVQAPPHRVRCRTRGVPPRARRSRRARTRLRGGARHRRRRGGQRGIGPRRGGFQREADRTPRAGGAPLHRRRAGTAAHAGRSRRQTRSSICPAPPWPPTSAPNGACKRSRRASWEFRCAAAPSCRRGRMPRRRASPRWRT